jgi:hypothetical protein
VLIEQIRYFFDPNALDEILEARRQVSRIRESLGVSAGIILIPDDPSEDEPLLVWQSSYEDESQLAGTEQLLIGSEEYKAARDHLGSLIARVDLDLFVSDEG